jgi:high affinity Mn2+ porin
MVYATGGLAWTYDQFTRTQRIGSPAGSMLGPGDQESLFDMPRFGFAAGAGAELALPSNWSARLEYLNAGFGTRSATFPLAGRRFDSSLAVQSVRLGFNYRIGQNNGQDGIDPDIFTKGIAPLDADWFNLHGQTTYLQQYAFPFRAPYRGANSLDLPDRRPPTVL